MPIRHPSDVFNDPTVLEALGRMPPLLYHYSGLSGDRLEWMRKLIVESKLYFAPPSAFNDPLDCRIPPTFDASALAIEHFWRPQLKQLFPLENPRAHKKRIRQMVMNSKTKAGQQQLTKEVFKTLDKNGIACFAKDPANMLLWSYYAEGHSGIAVSFNMRREHLAALGRQFMPIEVQYADNFPVVNYYKVKTHEFLRTLFGTKSFAWKHEEEWRVVSNTVGYVSLPPAMIDGVVLGMRTDPHKEATIRQWLKDRVPPVKLLRVVHKPRSFILDVIPA
jgi:hypothetical protein